MYPLIAVVSVISFLLLQYLDDQRTKRNHAPPSSSGSRVALFFFVVVIVTILFHFFWKESTNISKKIRGGDGMEKSYLSSMKEDIDVGLPDF